MNPKPGWVRYMENRYAMRARVDFLDEIREKEREKAAEVLQDEIATFVAHYGYASTERYTITWRTYVLLREGIILRKKEDDEGKRVTIKDLSLAEMKFLKEFMVETLNNDIQYIEDEIDRYIDLYL